MSSLARTVWLLSVFCLPSCTLAFEEGKGTDKGALQDVDGSVDLDYDFDGGNPSSQANSCQEGETEFQGKCYRPMHVTADAPASISMTYQEASMLCHQKGAALISIESEAENSFAYSLISSSNQTTWIGLLRYDDSEDFLWVAGHFLSENDFANWRSGEPSDDNGNEDCAVLFGPNTPEDYRGQWNDSPCEASTNANNRDYVLCERDPGAAGE
jgi:hypothetical protein